MPTPTVTIIVPTFNRAMYINECIDSLLAQSTSAREIIVVDDGSEDGTADRLAQYGERIRYVRKPNGGKPLAVNLALGLAQGDWIWIFDDDDVALPDAIERRLEVIGRNPDAGFVYSSHYLGADDAARRIVRSRLHATPEHGPEEFFLEIMRGCFFHLNSSLVRRSLFVELGGLDPTLLSSEDYDFQIRLARVARPAFCASPSFIFRQHGGVRGATKIRYAASDRNKVFRRYSQAVGRKIRKEVALGEFLCPSTTGELDAGQRHRALLNRLYVMANHGCVDEFVNDLAAVLEAASGRGGLSREDLADVTAAYRRGWAYDVCAEDWPGFVRSLRPLKGLAQGGACIRAVARSVLALGLGNGKSSLDRGRHALQWAALVAASWP